jgi:hypothetical protein
MENVDASILYKGTLPVVTRWCDRCANARLAPGFAATFAVTLLLYLDMGKYESVHGLLANQAE